MGFPKGIITMSLPFKEWGKERFLEVKTLVLFNVINMMKSPLRWSWIFWDGYKGNGIPAKIMRVARVLIGIAGICKLVPPSWVGLFFFVDGFYSIYRYRFEVPKTKSWYEDIPSGARSLFGYMLMMGFI